MKVTIKKFYDIERDATIVSLIASPAIEQRQANSAVPPYMLRNHTEEEQLDFIIEELTRALAAEYKRKLIDAVNEARKSHRGTVSWSN